MKQDEFFKIMGILVVSFFIIFMVMKMVQLNKNGSGSGSLKEGLELIGEAGTAPSYAAAVKANVVKLQDELLVAKYRKDYESVIINLDDYLGYLMIKQVLNMNLANDDIKTNIDTLNNLNTLTSAKNSLNATMTFLDKQWKIQILMGC